MTKILIVCSTNNGSVSSFITEQLDSLVQKGLTIEIYGITGKGMKGYLNNLSSLKAKIDLFKPDIVHAHFGLSGLLACLQRKTPVVVTLHGSDINTTKNRIFSRMAVFLSRETIFVEEAMSRKLRMKHPIIIPCGVNMKIFNSTPSAEARKKIGLDPEKIFILFAGAFNNWIKNSKLAQDAIRLLNNSNIELIELKDRSRKEVALLMNSCNVILMTSISEGSPQVIKEAFACNRPVVSTDVGDVKERFMGIEGCFICTYHAEDVAAKLKLALHFERTNARYSISNLELDLIADRIIEIYHSILKS